MEISLSYFFYIKNIVASLLPLSSSAIDIYSQNKKISVVNIQLTNIYLVFGHFLKMHFISLHMPINEQHQKKKIIDDEILQELERNCFFSENDLSIPNSLICVDLVSSYPVTIETQDQNSLWGQETSTRQNEAGETEIYKDWSETNSQETPETKLKNGEQHNSF